MADTCNFAHSSGLRAELRVTEKAANVLCGFIVPDVEENEAIFLVQQCGMIKAVIKGKKGRMFQPMQQRKNILAILHAEAANACTNLSEVNLLRHEQVALTLANVLIKNVHAARRCSPIFSSKASLAKLTASAIASRLTLP